MTSGGSQNQTIFKDKADTAAYLELLAKYKKQHGFKLYAYRLLPQRIHLLIETGDDPSISDVMHDLTASYTKYYNARYSQRGHLFESRFKSVLVQKDTYLAPMTRRLHLSETRVAAGGVRGAEEGVSSYSFYMGEPGLVSVPMDQERQDIFERIECAGADGYARYCTEADEKEIEDLDKRLRRGAILGDEEFVKRARKRIEEKIAEPAARPRAARSLQWLAVTAFFALLAAGTAAVALYVENRQVEAKYAALLAQKEEEFKVKSRFENRSPLSLTELDGTVWDVEFVPVSGDRSEGVIRDRIRFAGGRFTSDWLFSQGFGPVNYSLTSQDGGVTIWETLQSGASGGSASWRGDWKGDAMKGVLSFKPAAGPARDFSFFSVRWQYAGAAAKEDSR